MQNIFGRGGDVRGKPVRNVACFWCKCGDNITECWKRLIDKLRFFQPFSFSFYLSYSLTSCQVHQPKMASGFLAIDQILSLHCHSQQAAQKENFSSVKKVLFHMILVSKPSLAYQWERLLCSFAAVDPTDLTEYPLLSRSHTSSVLKTCASTNPGTSCVPSADCLTSNLH